MKKLSLALVCFALTACGNTPKNEVTKTIPQQQQGDPQKAFLRRCAEGLRQGDPEGVLNGDKSVCRVIIGTYSISKETSFTKIEDFPLSDNSAYPAGTLVMGSFESSTSAPEVLVDKVLEQRGNISFTATNRDGVIALRVYPGTYKALSYTAFGCFSSAGSGFISCSKF